MTEPRSRGVLDTRLRGYDNLENCFRHCERLVRRSSKSEGGSEAIHVAEQRKNGLLRRFAPRNDEAYVMAHQATQSRRPCERRDPSVSAIALIAAPRPIGDTQASDIFLNN